jgi:hypothetical protein
MQNLSKSITAEKAKEFQDYILLFTIIPRLTKDFSTFCQNVYSSFAILFSNGVLLSNLLFNASRSIYFIEVLGPAVRLFQKDPVPDLHNRKTGDSCPTPLLSPIVAKNSKARS